MLYQINHYNVFNFSSLNDIINGFLDKFELAGIILEENDFDYILGDWVLAVGTIIYKDN